MSVCNVCGEPHREPLYVGPADRSITSLCEIRSGKTEVFFCERCLHLQTQPLPEIDEYYETQYRILLDSDDEDQLYQVQQGKKIYRIQHQVQTLLTKVPLAPQAKVLDYGCAKGASANKLLQARPDLSMHLFDVSAMYQPFWERFSAASNWSTHEIKSEWRGTFDLVMSFYVLEHVVEPVAVLRQMASLLKPNGVAYWLVPDVLANHADFIVADHVNHFSPNSIATAVRAAGLRLLEIDGQSHEAGWIVTATLDRESHYASADSNDAATPASNEMLSARVEIHEIAKHWSRFENSIQQFEGQHSSNGPAAIYGSGFYGTFIASRLARLDKIACFVDQNPYRQGKTLFDKPIVAPENLADDVKTVYVGLNMRAARAAIADIPSWQDRGHSYFFL